MIVVEPIGGLCNYLRVVFSYYQKAIKDNEELVVVWKKTESCPGFFLDYFENVKNTQFIKERKNIKKVDYKGFSICPGLIPNYVNLIPNKKILQKIKNNVKLLEDNYDAIHVRRTDHVKLAKDFNSFTPDEEFIDFVNNSKSKYLYIATDNRKTQNNFLKRYKNKIKVVKLIDDSQKNLRKTSLEDAIIDLYMCIYSINFKGSGFSSFSDTIKLIRKQERPKLDL